MGIFDKLFGKKEQDVKEQQTVEQQTVKPHQAFSQQQTIQAQPLTVLQASDRVLCIPSLDLQNNSLRCRICYGDDTESVKDKESFPLKNQGVEKGNPWLIFMVSSTGFSTQVIYNFDRNQGELDQVSCQMSFEPNVDYENAYAAYRQFLACEYGEPVDPQKVKITLNPFTRAIINFTMSGNFMKMLGMTVARDHFDTWIVETERGSVKIDLITSNTTDTKSGKIVSNDLYLSYKLIPAFSKVEQT